MPVGEAKSCMLASKIPSRVKPRKTSSEAMRSVAAIGAANWSGSPSSITCEATHHAPQTMNMDCDRNCEGKQQVYPRCLDTLASRASFRLHLHESRKWPDDDCQRTLSKRSSITV